jgi:hypothetical protein
MKCEIVRLPHDILRVVASYLHDNYENAFFNYGLESKNLLNSSKSYFHGLKKVSQVISLSDKLSRLFLTSLVFRETVLSKIENRSEQLRFNLTDYSPSPDHDLSLLCPANKVYMRKCTTEISVSLVGIKEITLFECSIHDLSFCSQIAIVNVVFPDCESLLTPTLSSTTAFKVWSRYCQYKKSCKIENYERALSAVKEFVFTGCDSIVDVSCFKNADTVRLSGCPKISDVSSLENLRELDLCDCNMVRDMSALGRVNKLNIGNCPLVDDISALTRVYDLNITGFKGTNLSFLKSVKILNISNCRNITSLDSIGMQLEELIMSGCPSIRNITMLCKVKKLKLSCCSNITNFTGLASLEDLTIVQEYDENIAFCVLEGIETFKRIKFLGVEGFIEGLESIFSMLLDTGELLLNRSLSFDRTNPFTDLSRYQKLKTMLLRDCPVPVFIPETLIYLQKLSISRCPNVDLYLDLPALNELKILCCDSLCQLWISGNEKSNPMASVLIGGCLMLQEVTVSRRIHSILSYSSHFKIIDAHHLVQMVYSA